MKLLRMSLNGILLASTITLITLVADFTFSGNSYDFPIFVVLQVFHVSLALCYALYFLDFLKKRHVARMIFTAVPLALLALSIGLKMAGITFPGFLLILFDCYIIVWSSMLLEHDIGFMRK